MHGPFVPGLLLIAALTLCIAIYWIGLSGGFTFDDMPTFYYIQQWLDGKIGLGSAIFWNAHGTLLDKRALAMASYALSAQMGGGLSPFVFKLHNLLLHCAIGAAVYGLICQLLTHDRAFGSRYRLAALAATCLWLLHPLQVSTVLYSVQRMAQFSTLFCVLGMWLYMVGREKLDDGRPWPAAACLFLGIPLLTLLAIQGKQNGAILPFLCLVLEAAYFRQSPRPMQVRVFAGLFCVLPVVAVLIVLWLRPLLLMNMYGEYDFTPYERVLSQGRALVSYLGQFLIPHTPSMGLATDTFEASRGLLKPPSTLMSILLLAALSAAAITVRKRLPSVFAGWLLFLVGHAVESSFLPLELYYEHRNLMPSIGIVLALVALAVEASRRLESRGVRMGRVGAVAVVALILALGVMTHGRARVWSDNLVLYKSELDAHPESFRAVVNYVGAASDVGDVKRAYEVTNERLRNATSSNLRGRMYLLRAWLDCEYKPDGTKLEDFLSAIELFPKRVEIGTFLSYGLITETLMAKGCGSFGPNELAQAFQAMADHATDQSDTFLYKVAFRNNAALRYAEAGKWTEAAAQARLGWQVNTPPATAPVLIEVMLVTGDVKTARTILDEALARTGKDEQTRKNLEAIRPFVEHEEREPGWNKARAEGAQQ